MEIDSKNTLLQAINPKHFSGRLLSFSMLLHRQAVIAAPITWRGVINRKDFIFIPRSSHVINFQILHKTYDDETI